MRKFVLPAIVLSSLFSTLLWGQANPVIYSEVIPTSSGLSFDSATDIRETFQAPNGKTVEVLVKGPVGSGTYSRAIRQGETPDAYFPAVVAEAMKAHAHHLVIPKGVYAFHGPQLCTDLQSAACNQPNSCNAVLYFNCQPHWVIGKFPQGTITTPNSVSDLDIDLSGSELDFRAPVIGIWILNSQRIRLRNFTVDWPSLPIASLGTIVPDPDNPGHNALVIDPQYPVKDRFRDGPVMIAAVDPWDDSLDPPGTFGANSNNSFETYFIFNSAPQPTFVGKTAAGAKTFSCKSCNFQNSPTDPTCSFFQGCANFDVFAPGERVIVRHYAVNGFAFLINWSNDIDLENITLNTGPGMGFAVNSNGGFRGFRLYNSRVTRAPGRIISTAIDAINIGMKADVIVEKNDVGFQGDDGINIHTNPAAILTATGNQIAVSGACDPDPKDAPVVGDVLAFFDPNFVFLSNAHVVASDDAICGSLTLTLDHSIAGLGSSDSFLDLTQQPAARYIVRNNVFHENRGHGTLVSSPYGFVAANTYIDNSMGGIAVAGGAGTGPGASNLVLAKNLVTFPGESAQFFGAISMIAPSVNGDIVTAPIFRKIRLFGNIIEQTPGPGMVATSTRFFSFDHNTVLNSNLAQTGPINFGTLSTLDSVLVFRSSDGSLCHTTTGGDTTGPLGIDPSDRNVSVTASCP